MTLGQNQKSNLHYAEARNKNVTSMASHWRQNPPKTFRADIGFEPAMVVLITVSNAEDWLES